MSSITAVVSGDADIARLLASAASCGWNGAPGVEPALQTVATRCEWPNRLVDAVERFPKDQQLRLATAAARLLNAFEQPASAHTQLEPLLTQGRVAVTPVGVEFTTGDPAGNIAVAAAIGLLNLIATHGPKAAGICGSSSCTQPMIRTGRHHSSSACSARCANRLRVARHRRYAAQPESE